MVATNRNQLGLASDGAGQKEAAIRQLEDEILSLKKDMEDQEGNFMVGKSRMYTYFYFL